MSSTFRLTYFTASHNASPQLRLAVKLCVVCGRHRDSVSLCLGRLRCVAFLGVKLPLNLYPSKVRPGAKSQVQSGLADVAVLGGYLPPGLPSALYEALVAAILAIWIISYQQRPRGWSARDLVQAGPRTSLALSRLMQG